MNRAAEHFIRTNVSKDLTTHPRLPISDLDRHDLGVR